MINVYVGQCKWPKVSYLANLNFTDVTGLNYVGGPQLARVLNQDHMTEAECQSILDSLPGWTQPGFQIKTEDVSARTSVSAPIVVNVITKQPKAASNNPAGEEE